MTTGVHHVTAITRKVQANVDFYVGFLGLRLVKQTGGYEDAEQLHLFYGDAGGSPGSLVTFLVWEDGSAGRVASVRWQRSLWPFRASRSGPGSPAPSMPAWRSGGRCASSENRCCA